MVAMVVVMEVTTAATAAMRTDRVSRSGLATVPRSIVRTTVEDMDIPPMDTVGIPLLFTDMGTAGGTVGGTAVNPANMRSPNLPDSTS